MANTGSQCHCNIVIMLLTKVRLVSKCEKLKYIFFKNAKKRRFIIGVQLLNNNILSTSTV